MNNAAIIAQPGFDPYATATDAGWFGADIAKGIGKMAKKTANLVVKKAAPAVVKHALPAAQLVLRNAGPIGMAANAAVEATKGALSGKSIAQIGLAAARGAMPSGIDTALTAGLALARGDNVIQTAISAGANTFLKGSAERFAYSVAADALKRGATKGDLGVARRALATEGQRRAFDAAVGVAATALESRQPVKKGFAGLMQRAKAAQSAPASGVRTTRPTVARPVAPRPKASQQPRPMSSPRPGRATVSISKPAAPFALKSHAIAKHKRVAWKRLSPRAAAFLRKRVPHAPLAALVGRDAGALAGGAVAASMPTVRNGSTGAAVSTLQATLNQKRGANLVVDGKFGALTSAAVIAFQRSQSLVADGIVGQKTWTALDAAPAPAIPLPVIAATSAAVTRPTLRSGSRGPAVREAQTLLNLKNGAGLNTDGIFGSLTLTATKAFQRSKGLTVDGVIGPKTWGALDAAPLKSAPSTAPAPVAIPTLPRPVVPAIPTIGESAADTASVLQAKTILVAWSKTDGIAEPGFSDYGQRAEDMSTTFSTRDKFVATSFARWNNRTQGTTLSTSGDLSPELAAALRTWAEKRAAVAAPVALPPGPVTSPPFLPGPIATAPVGSPVIVQTPAGPVVTMPTDIINALPPFVPAPNTSPVPAPAPVVEAPAGDKPNAIALVGGGAVLGGLIGGPIGAVIGAAAGAVASA
jgi:peptidoglycan hydrolase-like protein with peptidoglycan-binding domain